MEKKLYYRHVVSVPNMLRSIHKVPGTQALSVQNQSINGQFPLSKLAGNYLDTPLEISCKEFCNLLLLPS